MLSSQRCLKTTFQLIADLLHETLNIRHPLVNGISRHKTTMVSQKIGKSYYGANSNVCFFCCKYFASPNSIFVSLINIQLGSGSLEDTAPVILLLKMLLPGLA